MKYNRKSTKAEREKLNKARHYSRVTVERLPRYITREQWPERWHTCKHPDVEIKDNALGGKTVVKCLTCPFLMTYTP